MNKYSLTYRQHLPGGNHTSIKLLVINNSLCVKHLALRALSVQLYQHEDGGFISYSATAMSHFTVGCRDGIQVCSQRKLTYIEAYAIA